jgi:hypothetical protein
LGGVLAEFALVDLTGRILSIGSRSALLSWTADLKDFSSIRESSPLYAGLPRANESTHDSPPLSGSSTP